MSVFLKNIIIWMMVLLFEVNPDSLTRISCNDDKKCITNCNLENCENGIIDASQTNTKSLTVLCNNCINSKILCPQNGICSINCSVNDGCNNMQIISHGYNADIYIICKQSSCRNMLINASNINLVDIKAIGQNSLSHSQIYAENVNKFILNCGDYGIISNNACLQNNLYLPSPIDNNNNNQVTINCFGESCRGSSIHVIHGMNGININILSNCQCNDDMNKCENYWYLFCDKNDKTNIGYVTFRDYQCLTNNITKCHCNAMQQYVMNNFKNDENDVNIICDIDNNNNNINNNNMNNNNNKSMIDIIDKEENLWKEIGDFITSDHTIIWIIMILMTLITLIIMCYLCAIKMNKYNEIQLVRTYDSGDLESDDANI